jgi:hypothetical protein
MKRNQTNRIDVAKWHYRWGWRLPMQFTQGSSLLATLGWRTQSLRDCGREWRNCGECSAPRERAGVRGNWAHVVSKGAGCLSHQTMS